MGLFLSTFENKVDRKGRVSVPAQFRANLAAQSFPGIVVYPSFTHPCLEACSFDFLERLAEGMEEHDIYSPEQEDISTLIFGKAKQLPWDPEGRIMLPEDLLLHANITDTAAFVGKAQTFQIWEPSAHAVLEAAAKERARLNPPVLRLRPRAPLTGGGS